MFIEAVYQYYHPPFPPDINRGLRTVFHLSDQLDHSHSVVDSLLSPTECLASVLTNVRKWPRSSSRPVAEGNPFRRLTSCWVSSLASWNINPFLPFFMSSGRLEREKRGTEMNIQHVKSREIKNY